MISGTVTVAQRKSATACVGALVMQAVPVAQAIALGARTYCDIHWSADSTSQVCAFLVRLAFYFFIVLWLKQICTMLVLTAGRLLSTWSSVSKGLLV